MNLLVFHPRVLSRSCADCRKWIYDDDHRPVLRSGKPIPRPSGSPTPCWSCPKKSPEHARELERDMNRIVATVELYYRIRGTAGRCLSARESRDTLLARNMAIVERIVQRADREHLARRISRLLSASLERA